MTTKNISDLRSALFDTLDALRDPEKPMEIERAKAVVDVAQTIINSAKVEVDFVKATGRATNGGFIPISDSGPPPKELIDETATGVDFDGKPIPKGITSVRRHRLVG